MSVVVSGLILFNELFTRLKSRLYQLSRVGFNFIIVPCSKLESAPKYVLSSIHLNMHSLKLSSDMVKLALTSSINSAFSKRSQSSSHEYTLVSLIEVHTTVCLDNLSNANLPIPLAPVFTLPRELTILTSLSFVPMFIQAVLRTFSSIPSPLSITYI